MSTVRAEQIPDKDIGVLSHLSESSLRELNAFFNTEAFFDNSFEADHAEYKPKH